MFEIIFITNFLGERTFPCWSQLIENFNRKPLASMSITFRVYSKRSSPTEEPVENCSKLNFSSYSTQAKQRKKVRDITENQSIHNIFVLFFLNVDFNANSSR